MTTTGRSLRPGLALATMAALGLTLLPAPAASAAEPVPAGSHAVKTELREVFSPDGTITRAPISVPATESQAPASEVAAAAVTPIINNGDPATHLDLVIVGDGYTSTQLGTYDSHVRSKVDELFAVEPFASYKSLFNVWKVDVVSQQSGVDHDPYGTYRTTALDMYFHCGGTARLLCVNETKANQYARQAPDVDQVVALANTTTYGGAGGGVATASGGNASAGQIVVHELGHSIGGLADEYDYGGGTNYTGAELREANASIHQRSTMVSRQTKWWRWMGQSTPDGGVIDTFNGCRYYTNGIYRPSSNSIMRTLGRQFNLPGREQMIASFYAKATIAVSEKPLSVVVPEGVGTLVVTWRVDGEVVASMTGRSDFDRGLLGARGAGSHRVTVTVTDGTDWVRDPALRKGLSATFAWTV
ncbi:M64 family metallopeptidase [Phytomonospora sp. NPDC050363]|uniref:M64 family metallopeptidase n=1 Tax=Phytomonospora sp. NPDC050363 TaxID=3155642 RepID=UPI003410F283